MKKEKTVDTHIYLPLWLLTALKQMAKRNRRTVTAEVTIALEDYMEARAATNGTPTGRKGQR